LKLSGKEKIRKIFNELTPSPINSINEATKAISIASYLKKLGGEL
jgi:hypothetical protein